MLLLGQQVSINSAFVITALVCATIVGVTIVVGLGYVVVWGYKNDQHQIFVREFMVHGPLPRLGTVVAVVSAAVVLALAGALNEGVVALLSGIAGYVLGGIPLHRDSNDIGRSTGSRTEANEG